MNFHFAQLGLIDSPLVSDRSRSYIPSRAASLTAGYSTIPSSSRRTLGSLVRREVNSIPRRIQFLSDALSFSLVPGGDSNLESIDSRPLWRRSSLSFGGFHLFHLSDWTITSRNNPAVSYQAQVFGEYRLIIPDDRDYRDRFKVAASILLESFSYNFVVITFAEGCLIVVQCFYLSCIKLD